MHCAKEVSPPPNPNPKRSQRYLCMYLPQGHHHKPKRSQRYLCTYYPKGTTTKIHVMIFSWWYVWFPGGRVHRAGIREWGKESDWLLCTEGWREKYKLNLVWEHREKKSVKLNLIWKNKWWSFCCFQAWDAWHQCTYPKGIITKIPWDDLCLVICDSFQYIE